LFWRRLLTASLALGLLGRCFPLAENVCLGSNRQAFNISPGRHNA
jgi:hypothetical protein